jgi:hypothetical protein
MSHVAPSRFEFKLKIISHFFEKSKFLRNYLISYLIDLFTHEKNLHKIFA